MDGLREVGIRVSDTDFDIEKLIQEVKPRVPKKSELDVLRYSEERVRFVIKDLTRQDSKKEYFCFADWYEDPGRRPWKLGWWTISGEPANEAKSKAFERYGISEPKEFLNTVGNTVKPNEWILMARFTDKSVTSVKWMFAEFVVSMKKGQSEYDEQYPRQAVQPLALKRYAEPPFKIDSAFKHALQDAVLAFGISRIEKRRSLIPPDDLLRDTYSRVSAN